MDPEEFQLLQGVFFKKNEERRERIQIKLKAGLDDGTTVNAGSFVIFERSSGLVLLGNPIALWFSRGGVGPSGSAHGLPLLMPLSIKIDGFGTYVGMPF